MENLAASGEYHKVRLAKAMREAISGVGCDYVKTFLESRERLGNLVENNCNLPEIKSYNEKRLHLSIMHTKSKLFMLGNVFPEAGIKIDWNETGSVSGDRAKARADSKACEDSKKK